MKYLYPIQDRSEIESLQELMESMIDAPHLISVEWLRASGWCAVPVPERPSDSEMETICRAASQWKLTNCVVVVNEPQEVVEESWEKGFPLAYRLTLCPERLVKVNSDPVLWHFVIFPPCRSFAILQGELCYIVAGPRSFLQEAISELFEVTWRRLNAERKLQSGDKEGKVLETIIDRYEPFNGIDSGESGGQEAVKELVFEIW